MFQSLSKKKKMKVPEAFRILCREEAEKLVDQEKVNEEALERAQQNGIIFIDEIDKVTNRHEQGNASVSRESSPRSRHPRSIDWPRSGFDSRTPMRPPRSAHLRATGS